MGLPDRAELQDGARVILSIADHSLRSLDGRRRAALAVAVVMLLVLFAPWYGISVSAPGARGSRLVLHQSLSGWQALSVPAILCAVAAVATIALLLARTGAPVDGLGAAGRRAARSRTDGRLITVAAAIAGLGTLIGLGLQPTYPATLPGATSATSIHVGIVLAVLASIALAAIGARIAQAPRDPGARPSGDPPRQVRGRPRRGTGSRTRTPRAHDASWSKDDVARLDFTVDRPPG